MLKISKHLKDKLPDDERGGIEERLWSKSGGNCFLCDRALNLETAQIEPDHDVPEGEGGETKLTNLNLTHKLCNRVKSNYPSLEIRPYLQFAAFVSDHEGPAYYGDCLDHFAIKPKTVTIEREEDSATFHLPNGDVVTVPVYAETPGDRSEDFEFAFVDLPRSAIHHDSECQPRSIKMKQVKAIFADLARNPLHEQPTVRVGGTGSNKLLLFDGQHKTLAKWIGNNDSVVTKIYLNLTKDQANYLVGSIQSVVKKLPLTPFELADKMNDEFRERFEDYEQGAGGPISEEGFIASLPTSDRRRGKKELQSALVALLLDNEDPTLELKDRIDATTLGIKQVQFISKVLQPLVQFSPLATEGEEAVQQRTTERENVIQILNLFDQICIAPGAADGASVQEKERSKRMIYQLSLGYCMKLLKGVAAQYASRATDDAFLAKPLNKGQLKKVAQSIEVLSRHPVWTADLEAGSVKLRRVDEALKKNQNADQVFRGVHLTVGHLLKTDELPADWDQ